MGFHNSNSSVGCKMKNKRSCSVKYILLKNVKSSGNSIIYRWISMLLSGICETTGAAVLTVDGGEGYENRQVAVLI
jgi:hypothetical protein